MTNNIQPTVLVIDDDEFQHKLITSVLTAEKYNVISAYSGVAAMTILLRKRPDLVLMDYHMPDYGGLDVLKKIKDYHHISGVPIIMITGEHTKRVVIDCLSNGASGFIVKPFTREVLLLKVDTALSINLPEVSVVVENPEIPKAD